MHARSHTRAHTCTVMYMSTGRFSHSPGHDCIMQKCPEQTVLHGGLNCIWHRDTPSENTMVFDNYQICPVSQIEEEHNCHDNNHIVNNACYQAIQKLGSFIMTLDSQCIRRGVKSCEILRVSKQQLPGRYVMKKHAKYRNVSRSYTSRLVFEANGLSSVFLL